jgi:hypothetical protein
MCITFGKHILPLPFSNPILTHIAGIVAQKE